MKAKTRETTEIAPRRELGLVDDMDRLFEGLFHRGLLRPFRDLWPEWARMEDFGEMGETPRMPRIDVVTRDEEVVIRAEMPGVAREDVAVELAGELLTIRGERRHASKTEEKGELVRAEIARGTFARTMSVPAGLDTEHVTATLADGILEVHLPRIQKTARKRIEVA